MSSNKDSNTQHAEREWQGAIAICETRIEDLKVRYDAEFRRLHTRLDSRVAELQSELKKLAAMVERDVPDAHARRIAGQLDELRAKSDAAYDLLQATLKPMGHNEPSNPH